MNEHKYFEDRLPDSFDVYNNCFYEAVDVLRRYLTKKTEFTKWIPALMKDKDSTKFFAIKILPAYTTRYKNKYRNTIKNKFNDNFGIIIEEYDLGLEKYLVMPLSDLYNVATLCKMKGI